MRGFAKFILAGRFNAIFITGFFGAMSFYLLPLSLFSGTALALVTLRKGLVQAVYIAVVAALLILASWALSPAKPGFPFPVVFVLWVPLLCGACWLRASASQRDAVLAVGAVCGLFVVAMYLAVGDVVTWWNEWILTAMPEVHDQGAEFGAGENIQRANGYVAMFLGFGAMFSILSARWMQATLFNPGAFAPEFAAIKIPRAVLVGVLLILLVCGSQNDQMMMDLFMVAMMIYLFQGLAIVHGVVLKRRINRNWLVLPYLGLFFVPQILIPGLAVLGVTDTFIDYRSRRR